MVLLVGNVKINSTYLWNVNFKTILWELTQNFRIRIIYFNIFNTMFFKLQ